MARERIGIMGGTFNPIHMGHIAMAKEAARDASLDRVLMIPTGNPPHKSGITPAEDRWRMTCAAVANEQQLTPCRMELDRSGVIYTVDTLSELHRIYPEADLFYIIGADTLMELKNWRQYEKVLTLCTFLVCPRTINVSPKDLADERARLEALGGRFEYVSMHTVDVSSTEIREALISGNHSDLLPDVCSEYAHIAGLYGLEKRIADGPALLEHLWAALSAKRFAHTLGVAYAARELALMHGVDPVRAELAGLLHDCAKCLPEERMRAVCLDNGLTDDPAILASGNLMHSLAGAWIAEHEYGVRDPEVLHAIACHTMGEPGMSPLDMVVYLADKIEPTRPMKEYVLVMRMMAHDDLRKGMLCSLQGTADYVKQRGDELHPLTAQTLAWLNGRLEQ